MKSTHQDGSRDPLSSWQLSLSFLEHLVVTTPGSDWCHQKSGIKHGSLKILKSREQCRGYAFSRSVDLFTGYLRTTATSRLVNHVQSRRRFANLAMPSVNSPTSFPWRGVLWTQLDTTETLRKMAMVPIENL